MNKNLIIFGMLTMLICVGLSGCNSQEKATGTNNGFNDEDINDEYWDDFIDENTPREVEFILECSPSVKDVSMDYTVGSISYDTDWWSVPFEQTYYAFKGDWVYMMCQNNGYDYGWISLELYVDGLLIESDISSSQYGIVSVSTII